MAFDYSFSFLLCLVASHVDFTQALASGPRSHSTPFIAIAVCQPPITSQLGNLKGPNLTSPFELLLLVLQNLAISQFAFISSFQTHIEHRAERETFVQMLECMGRNSHPYSEIFSRPISKAAKQKARTRRAIKRLRFQAHYNYRGNRSATVQAVDSQAEEN